MIETKIAVHKLANVLISYISYELHAWHHCHHKEILYYQCHARLLFGSHETSPVLWMDKPAPAIKF
jgi:hypothetical protein